MSRVTQRRLVHPRLSRRKGGRPIAKDLAQSAVWVEHRRARCVTVNRVGHRDIWFRGSDRDRADGLVSLDRRSLDRRTLLIDVVLDRCAPRAAQPAQAVTRSLHSGDALLGHGDLVEGYDRPGYASARKHVQGHVLGPPRGQSRDDVLVQAIGFGLQPGQRALD
jgi:hypothetical protein